MLVEDFPTAVEVSDDDLRIGMSMTRRKWRRSRQAYNRSRQPGPRYTWREVCLIDLGWHGTWRPGTYWEATAPRPLDDLPF